MYPINSSDKKLYERKKEGSFMVYTNSRSTMKFWEPYTKKPKYCSFAKFDEHNNKFGKIWSPGSELMRGKNNSTLHQI